MRNYIFIFSLFVLSGCSSRSLYDGLGAGVGGLAGHHFSKGNPYITAASAVGGVILADSIQNAGDKGRAEVYQTGYDKGQSDAVKRQYWIARNLHKEKPGEFSDDHLTYYSVPIEPNPNAEVQLVPHEETLSFME